MHKRLLIVVLFVLASVAVSAGAQERSAKSDDALAYLNLDIENRPGWVVGLKGGYQWKFVRDAGATLTSAMWASSHGYGKNFTEDGLAGTITLGRNFGPRLPLTLGIALGLGPDAKMNTYSSFTDGGNYSAHSYQRIRVWTLDVGADYDFKNCSRWTPFVGVTGGLGFISHKGKTEVTSATDEWSGKYGTKHRTNLVVGGRAGVKWDMNDRVTWSLYGSYSYLGKVPAYGYTLQNAAATSSIQAKTNKVTIHQLDAKVGVKIRF